jgi:RHH-type rel operon transcriptional repressor/antitoxin RelB
MAVSIRLDPEIERRLDQLASQTGRAKSYYLRELIVGGLDDLEDFYLADATIERVRKGTEKVFTASQGEERSWSGSLITPSLQVRNSKN